VDNTPPVVDKLEGLAFFTRNGTLPPVIGVKVQFVARAATSSIARAQYRIDGGDWIVVTPKNGISDAPEEHYEFTVSLPEGSALGSEHTVAVRAYDRFENVGSAKTTVTVPAAKP